MKDTNQPLQFTVSITKLLRNQARQFANQQSHPKKSQQVYYNTLAVLAVNFYCQCMEIETDIQASDSCNPIMQTLSNVADLHLPGFGVVECRPVLKNANAVEIPRESRAGRLGYIAVSFDESEQEAQLMGFVDCLPAKEEVFAVKRWKSLDGFLVKLEQLEGSRSSSPSTLTTLSQWLRGHVQKGWESWETLLSPERLTPVWAVRGSASPTQVSSAIRQGKLLYIDESQEPIALLMSLPPDLSEEMDISVEVRSLYPETNLPVDLQISILDNQHDVVMNACAKTTQHIKLNFAAEPGEKFSVKVGLGAISFTENFVV